MMKYKVTACYLNVTPAQNSQFVPLPSGGVNPSSKRRHSNRNSYLARRREQKKGSGVKNSWRGAASSMKWTTILGESEKYGVRQLARFILERRGWVIGAKEQTACSPLQIASAETE